MLVPLLEKELLGMEPSDYPEPVTRKGVSTFSQFAHLNIPFYFEARRTWERTVWVKCSIAEGKKKHTANVQWKDATGKFEQQFIFREDSFSGYGVGIRRKCSTKWIKRFSVQLFWTSFIKKHKSQHASGHLTLYPLNAFPLDRESVTSCVAHIDGDSDGVMMNM